jgi:hypothetical protein
VRGAVVVRRFELVTHFATGHAPGDGVTPKRVHRPFVDDFTGKVTGLGIALQQPLPFKISANTLCDALRQFKNGPLQARRWPN